MARWASAVRGGRRRYAVAAVVAVMGLLGAACGDDDDGGTGASGEATTGAPSATSEATSANTTAPDDDVDPAGVVRWGTDLIATPKHFDPIKTQVPTVDLVHMSLVYDTLLRPTLDGGFEPSLATEATIVDPRTIEVQLREGVAFSDGTPFDANAVKASIERNQACAQCTGFQAELKEIASVEVVDPTSFRLHLKSDNAGAVYALLAQMETVTPSPAALAAGTDLETQPVGAGPFVLERFEPERVMVFAKNERYWNADAVKLAGIEFVHTPAGQPILNALRSGTIDIANIDPTALDGLGNEFSTDVRTSETNMLWMPVCKRQAPFDDVRVRQALSYAIDRDAVNEALLDGRGEVMWGLWSSASRFHDPTLEDHYAYDPERARALLAEAGYADGFSADIGGTPTPIVTRFAEVLQQQWGEVGVRLNIVSSANFTQEFYAENRMPLGIIPSTRNGLVKITGPFQPGSFGNVCQYSDPELDAIINQLRVVQPDSDEAIELWADAQQLVLGKALSFWITFLPVVHAWDGDRLGGMDFISYSTTPMPDFFKLYVKA